MIPFDASSCNPDSIFDELMDRDNGSIPSKECCIPESWNINNHMDKIRLGEFYWEHVFNFQIFNQMEIQKAMQQKEKRKQKNQKTKIQTHKQPKKKTKHKIQNLKISPQSKLARMTKAKRRQVQKTHHHPTATKRKNVKKKRWQIRHLVKPKKQKCHKKRL